MLLNYIAVHKKQVKVCVEALEEAEFQLKERIKGFSPDNMLTISSIEDTIKTFEGARRELIVKLEGV